MTGPIAGADIEIIERISSVDEYGNQVVMPNTVRINGHEVLIPADASIQISEIRSDDCVTVNLTLFCRSLTIKAEEPSA